MLRVIAGAAKGRRLRTTGGRATRPMGERMREALFSSLTPALSDAVVLDLWAGSGSLAIEALSRGARRAVLVERQRAALAVLRDNVTACGFAARARVVADDVAAFAERADDGPFDVILADPPYAIAIERVWAVLGRLHAGGALTGDAEVVLHRPAREPVAEPPAPLALQRVRPYGDAALWRLRVAGRAAPVEDGRGDR
jgi:16S rRNA (guanine966-N2)-methyltransferase